MRCSVENGNFIDKIWKFFNFAEKVLFPAGHAGLPLHPPPRLSGGEAQLDVPPVRPQPRRVHHQERDGRRGGGRL